MNYEYEFLDQFFAAILPSFLENNFLLSYISYSIITDLVTLNKFDALAYPFAASKNSITLYPKSLP